MSVDSYQIRVSRNEGRLLVFISGGLAEPKKATANEIAAEVANLLEEYKPEKVLIDCTAFNERLSVFETYQHVREHKRSKHRPAKLAVLDTQENRDNYRFHETTGANAGLSSRFFPDFDEALRWLNA